MLRTIIGSLFAINAKVMKVIKDVTTILKHLHPQIDNQTKAVNRIFRNLVRSTVGPNERVQVHFDKVDFELFM